MVTMAEFRELMQTNASMMKTIENLTKDGQGARCVGAAGEVSKLLAEHKPTRFDGTGGPEKLKDWLREIQKLFVTVGCPNELKVDQAAFYFRGAADVWWYNNQDHLKLYNEDDNGEETTFGWSDFKKALRKEFFPQHLRNAKRTEFNNLRQGDMSMEEYYKKFMELSTFVTYKKLSDRSLATRFEDGLDLDLLEKMKGRDPATVRKVYKEAGHAERIRNKRKAIAGEKKEAEQNDNGNRSRKKGNFNRDQSRSSDYRQRSSQWRRDGSRVFFCKKCDNNHPGKEIVKGI